MSRPTIATTFGFLTRGFRIVNPAVFSLSDIRHFRQSTVFLAVFWVFGFVYRTIVGRVAIGVVGRIWSIVGCRTQVKGTGTPSAMGRSGRVNPLPKTGVYESVQRLLGSIRVGVLPAVALLEVANCNCSAVIADKLNEMPRLALLG